MTYGYLRVSTDKQDMESQKIGVVKKSEEIGLPIGEWIEDDGVSGTVDYSKRNLGKLMEKLKEGDVIIISEISRLARTIFMLFRIIEFCNNKKIIIYSVKDSISTVKPNDLSSMMMIFCFGIAAQIEREMIVKRTIEGIEKRKAAGVIFGRPVGAMSKKSKAKDKILIEQIGKFLNEGKSKQSIAKNLGISKTTLYRIIQAQKIPCKLEKSFFVKKTTSNIIKSEMQNIIRRIGEGKNTKGVHAELIAKGHKISYASLSALLRCNKKIHRIWKAKNKELRMIHNVDCGKNKQHYRF